MEIPMDHSLWFLYSFNSSRKVDSSLDLDILVFFTSDMLKPVQLPKDVH